MTFENLKDNTAMHFMWTEIHGELQGSVFATIYVNWVEECYAKYPNTKSIILWSDSCTYQNKNRYLAEALLLLSKRLGIDIIQKFLIRGYTQMEADTVHSRIEANKRGRRIHLPSEYISIIESATKKKGKYQVKMLESQYFDDYHSLHIIPGLKPPDTTVNKIHVLKYYKVRHDDEYKLLRKYRKIDYNAKPEKLFASKLKIASNKWQHLQPLATLIPEDCRGFYENIEYE